MYVSTSAGCDAMMASYPAKSLLLSQRQAKPHQVKGLVACNFELMS